MRLVLELSCSLLPVDYRRAGLSFIKGIFAVVDRELYEKYYVERKFRKKPYTFTMKFKAKRLDRFIFPENDRVEIHFATSDDRVFSAVVNWFSTEKGIEASITPAVKTVFLPEKLRIVPEKFSKNVVIRDFVLPKKFLELRYPERFKGLPLEEQIRRYVNDQGYAFEEIKLKPKETVYGIKGKVVPKFMCHDLYLFGVKGNLPKLYREGLGQYKSQGFGFPEPIERGKL